MTDESRSSLNDSFHVKSVPLTNFDDNKQVSRKILARSSSNYESTLGRAPSPCPKLLKTVKSITKEFELHHFPNSIPDNLPKGRKSSRSSTPLYEEDDADKENQRSDNQTKQYKRRSRSFGDKSGTLYDHHHNRRASVLLASASFPSTLKAIEADSASRARTVSAHSHLAGLRNSTSSLKLASAAYPSSYSSNTGFQSSSVLSSKKRDSMSVGLSSAGSIPSLSLPTLSISQEEDSDPINSRESKTKAQGGEEEDDDQMTELSSCPASPRKSSLSTMTAAERREHSRRHSRVHSRNLSVFFPQPGSEAETEIDYIKAMNHFGKPAMSLKLDQIGIRDTNDVQADTSGVNLSPTKSRRGHHRKHSVNHGLFNITNSHHLSEELISPKTTRFSAPDKNESNRKRDIDLIDDAVNVPKYVQALSQPISQNLRLTSLSSQHRLLLLFGILEFTLGAMLWWSGQSGDSLSLTGLGYLVVFDAFGILNAVAAEDFSLGSRQDRESKSFKDAFRKAYGPYRMETVLQFSQTVYLLFASIYVCKESVEHALLESEDGHHEEDDIGLHLPRILLIFSSACCLFSIMVLHNHDKLVAACGIATSSTDKGTSSAAAAHRKGSHGRRNSILVDPSTLAGPFINLLANPFSITIIFFCLTLSIASIIMPPFQVAALDKVLAGLESVAMLYIAYPASVALGKILLQTAPKSYNTQNVQLMRSLQTIGEHPLVTYVAPPHLWQLTPPTSAINQRQSGPNSYSPSSSSSILGSQRTAKNAALIAMVQIFLKEEASDENILQMTKWAWSLLAPAVGAGAGLRAGESLRGTIRAGEVVVSVSREGQREKYRLKERACDHDHSHPCNNGVTHDHNDHHHSHSHGHHNHDHQPHKHNHHNYDHNRSHNDHTHHKHNENRNNQTERRDTSIPHNHQHDAHRHNSNHAHSH